MSFYYGDESIVFERVQRPQATGKVLIKVYPDWEKTKQRLDGLASRLLA